VHLTKLLGLLPRQPLKLGHLHARGQAHAHSAAGARAVLRARSSCKAAAGARTAASKWASSALACMSLPLHSPSTSSTCCA
jgi:hypothetical protein